jgi:hypothetical protein
MIFLGLGAAARLGGGVPFAEVVTQTFVFDLSAYPRWMLVLAGTLLAVVTLWVLMKLLKWTLWLLLFIVFVGGLAWAGWELVQSLSAP